MSYLCTQVTLSITMQVDRGGVPKKRNKKNHPLQCQYPIYAMDAEISQNRSTGDED